MQADLQSLASAVAGVAGGSANGIVFVAAPAQAQAIRTRMVGTLGYDVFASSALASGTVMAIALPALVSVMDDAPRLEFGAESLLHLEDTTPLMSQPARRAVALWRRR